MNDLSSMVVPYAAAAFGSMAVELAALVRDLGANDGKLPLRYRTWSYPTFRVLFIFVAAGPLAVLFEANSIVTAFYIGGSAPLIYDRVASGIKVLPRPTD